jgi:beta-lactamase regulating signal transducer with metallopeptidase domain
MTMTLLLLALKSLLVAAVTLGLLRLTRTRSAAERSTIAHLGLFALVALPLASLALPTLNLPMPAPMARIAAIDPVEKVEPALPARDQETPIPAASAPSVASESTLVGALSGAARYAFLLPTLVLLALTLAALLRLVGLRARAEVLVDPDWLSALARAQRRMGFKNGTALLWSDELGSPVSWGMMRPVILLNNAAVAAPEQAEAIIAHELAHVVHFDWAKLILARVATATFWFNPLAWVLAREAHQLREESADDAVLAANIAGVDYAELLIGVARHQCRGTLLGAHGVAPSRSSLGRRVRRVLDQSPARGPSGRSWVAGFTTGMLSMAVPLAAVTFVPGHNALATIQTTPAGQHPAAIPSSPVPRRDSIASVANAGARAADPGPAGLPATAAPVAITTGQDQGTSLGTATSRQSDSGDEADNMRVLGISADYQRGMAQAGFPNLSSDQLAEARAGGVSPDYARDMRATGMRLSLDDVIEARNMGLSAAYIAAMRGVGIKGDLDDYQGMRSVGVTADFVRKLRARGITTTDPDELTSLRAAGGNGDP